MREYERTLTVKGDWQASLDRHSMQWAVLPRTASLVPALQAESWQTLYSDQTAIILRRP